MHEGKPGNDILAGATDAIVGRVKALLDQVGIEEDLCISGGVARNVGVVKRLENKFGLEVCVAPKTQIVGALQAGFFAADRCKT
jgi:activator of 2-hydroxyglutaryl-CoA dehydratase